MEIKEIKSRLSIREVLDHYGLKANKNQMLHCPFHKDKTPSMQVYPKTDTVYCFSASCKSGGKRLDVIDLIELQEDISKHEAIRKATALASATSPEKATAKKPNPINSKPSPLGGTPLGGTPPIQYAKLFKVFSANLKKSKQAQQYLQRRGLLTNQEIGYNGQAWGRMHYCLIFPLKDEQRKIVSFYGRTIMPNTNADHFYLPNRKGLYPQYPAIVTEKLILTESIIDATTLLQVPAVWEHYTILACYGTNGFTKEHQQAVAAITNLQEVILFFDGDEAGKSGTKKLAEQLHQLRPTITISRVDTPVGEDVNSLGQSHELTVFTHLLDQRISFSFSLEVASSITTPEPPAKSSEERKKPAGMPVTGMPVTGQASESTAATNQPDTTTGVPTTGTLDTRNPHRLVWESTLARYTILGGLRTELDSLKVSLVIESSSKQSTFRKYRHKLDLYEQRQSEKLAREAGDKLSLRADLLEVDLHTLTDLLESYRETQASNSPDEGAKTKISVPPEVAKQCIAFLQQPNLLPRLNELIGRAGVVGEEQSRLLLLLIASSYSMPDPLHGLIQGSSGSGKTHLLVKISELIPSEVVKRFTRVTESSLYNYGQYELSHQLLCLEDLDGMKEEAQLAFRELQSRGMLSSSTSGQDEQGNIKAFQRIVYGPIASLSCTTRGEVYEDNMSRCFLVAVDESTDQTEQIIAYHNRRASGEHDRKAEAQSVQFIQQCLRLLKSYEVVNPYAGQVSLPPQAHKIRRLHSLYQSFVKQVTLWHQYQRKQDGQGRLISQKEDLELASEIMFDSIVLKVDELDGALRQFFERLKQYVRGQSLGHEDTYRFSQREVRQALRISKTQMHRYLRGLLQLEYIRQTGGYANRGYEYKITYWDNVQALRSQVKRHLQGQLDQLELITV